MERRDGRGFRNKSPLRDLSSPRALVIRDGRQQRIAGREVVRDDIVLVSELAAPLFGRPMILTGLVQGMGWLPWRV